MRRFLSFRDFDWTLLAAVLLICALSVLEIYSATLHTKYVGFHTKQMFYIAGGLVAMFIFAKAISEGSPLILFNRGQMRRDFTYIDDVVEAVERLIAKHGDAKILYLLADLTNCPKVKSSNIYDRCKAKYERLTTR